MTEVPAPDASAPAASGIASLDSVLDLVAGLDQRPLSEHAAVFESAHAELRRTLDDPPTDLTESGDAGASA
jgi:hypothetical protein